MNRSPSWLRYLRWLRLQKASRSIMAASRVATASLSARRRAAQIASAICLAPSGISILAIAGVLRGKKRYSSDNRRKRVEEGGSRQAGIKSETSDDASKTVRYKEMEEPASVHI